MPVLVDDAECTFARFEELLPSTVTITRTSERDFKSRQLNVWIDGVRMPTLLWGDSFTHELAPGTHRLRVSNTRWLPSCSSAGVPMPHHPRRTA